MCLPVSPSFSPMLWQFTHAEWWRYILCVVAGRGFTVNSLHLLRLLSLANTPHEFAWRLAPTDCFPALGTGRMFSRAWHRLNIFPRLAPVECFPALGTRWMFPTLRAVWIFGILCFFLWRWVVLRYLFLCTQKFFSAFHLTYDFASFSFPLLFLLCFPGFRRLMAVNNKTFHLRA